MSKTRMATGSALAALALLLTAGCKCSPIGPGQGALKPEARALVTVAYPGASPAEVETGLALPLEAAVQGLKGLTRLESRCREGLLLMEVAAAGPPELEDMWLGEVREALAQAQATLPAEAEAPRLSSASARLAGLVVLAGEMPPGQLAELGDGLRLVLERIPGLHTATPLGQQTSVVRVAVDPARLAAFGSNPLAVERALTASLVGRSGILPARDERLIRIDNLGEPTLAELRQLEVFRSAAGRPVRLSDLATISVDLEQGPVRVWSSAGPGLALALALAPGAAGVEAWSQVTQGLIRFAEQAPPALRLATWVLDGPATPPLVAARLGWPPTAAGAPPAALPAALTQALSGFDQAAAWVLVAGRPALPGAFAGWQGLLLAMPREASEAGVEALSAGLGTRLRRLGHLAASVAPLRQRLLPASSLQVLIQGPQPAQIGPAVAAQLRQVPGVAAVWAPDGARPELDVRIDRERLAALGLSSSDVNRSLRLALAGQRIGSVRDGQRSAPLLLTLAGPEQDEASRLAALPLALPAGGQVTLSQVARMEQRLAPAEILRLDGRRTVRLEVELGLPFDAERRGALLVQARAALDAAPAGTSLSLR